MGRLTKYGETSHENGVCCTHFMGKECKEVGGECAYGCKWEEEAWSKLAHYEDLEEQGRMITLPCAVGDTVWCIYEKKIYKGTVTVIKPFVIEKGELLYININVSFEMKDPFYGDGRILTHEMYGRYLETVFLTKEEAEAKLRDLLEIENVKIFKEKCKELKELEGAKE